MIRNLKTRIFTLFLTFVMFASFNLSFYPAPVYAQDEKQTYIYQPSEEFNDAKTKTETWTPKTINKILMGLFAVVAIGAAKYAYDPTGQLDCPTNKAASITIPAIVAGSIAYIGGEMQANIRYKNAAKKASDLNFNNTNTDDTLEGNKQVQAFDSLIEIYDQQVGAANTKIALSSIGQLGYTAAAGIEIGNILACKAKCKGSWAAQNSLVTGSLSTVTGSLCPAAAPFVTAYTGLVAKATAKDGAFTAELLSQQAAAAKNMGDFITGITSSVDSTIPNINAFTDMAKRMAKAVPNSAINGTSATSLQTATAPIVAAAAVPYTSVMCSAALGGANALITAMTATPVFCCGVDSLSNSTWLMNPAGLDKFSAQKDIYFINYMGKAIEGKIVYNKGIEELTTIIAYNALYEEASEKILNSDLTSENKIEQLAKLDSKLREAFEYLDQNMDGFSLPSYQVDELAGAVLAGNMAKLKNLLDNISDSLRISHAYADVNFMDVLGWGGKILLLRTALKKIYTSYAGTSPKARSIYFSLLTAIGGYVLTQDIKTAKDLKKRRDIVKAEKDKFQNAGETDSDITEGSGDNILNLKQGNYNLGKKGLGNYTGCIAPTGDSYAPATCPSIIPRNSVKIPELSKNMKTQLGTPYVSSLNALEGAAYNAASGAYLDNPNLLSADLAAASKNSQAMRNTNDKLRKKLDEIEKNDNVKDSKGNIVKPVSLGEFHQKMMDQFGQGGSNSGFNQAQELASAEDKKEEEKKEGAIAAVAAYEPVPVAPSSSFNLDLGLDDEAPALGANSQEGSIENLDDYIVEQNDISNKKEVSIFRLLSNRYLLSYPKILEENKR